MDKKIMYLALAAVVVIAAVLVMTMPKGGPSPGPGPEPEPGPSGKLEIKPIDLSDINEGISPMARHYSLQGLNIDLEVPQYTLPLKTSDVSNYAEFSDKITLSSDALKLLQKNGFVVVDDPFNSRNEYFGGAYAQVKDNGIPVFVTTDSLLHMYHIQFDESLREIEENEFYGDLWNITKSLLVDSINKYNDARDGDLKEALRRDVAYFGVALNLLAPTNDQLCKGDVWECRGTDAYFTSEELNSTYYMKDWNLPDEAAQELSLIGKHEGLESSPIFKYKEDYSQYVPRGHYTRSEKLKNYFKTMMWYGRLSMLLKGDLIEGVADPEREARIQTIQASLISAALADNKGMKSKWERIYSVTAFYVGFSDDLGPYEYLDAMNKVFGNEFKAADLNSESISKLKAELATYRAPKIYGGTGWGADACSADDLAAHPEKADQCLDATKGMRFMGQRFIPDSYMFQQLVELYVGGRFMPKGLDAMALLGSDRAYRILEGVGETDYQNYVTQFNKLKAEFDNFTEVDWNKNLYWSWLYALKPLLTEFGNGYPTFMQTDAWQDKELSTALASWTELRHDTILYAKQSYAMQGSAGPIPVIVKPPVVGYIEPVPEFYNRLLALTDMTKNGLSELDALSEPAKARMNALSTLLQRLRNLSIKELGNEGLTQDDYDFVKNFNQQVDYVIGDVEDKAKKTTIVADVHTDPNSGSVLEEGVGYINYVVVAYKMPDGRVLIGAGPIMSYYEFTQPMSGRLTDEKWREMLQSNPPDKPEWTSSFASY